MEMTNKITQLSNKIKHSYRIKQRRKLSLKLNYSLGLLNELDKNPDIKLKQDIDRINRYFEEDTADIQKRISGVHINLDIIQDKTANYDKKLYWKKRRFKTLHKNDSQLDLLLKQFDEEETQKHDLFVEKLNTKYFEKTYTTDQLQKYKDKLSKYKDIKEKRVSKAKNAYEKNKINSQKQIEILNFKVKSYRQSIESLVSLINEYNHVVLKHDHDQFDSIEKSLVSNITSKRKEILELKKEDLSNKLFINENQDAHLSIQGLKMYFGGIKAVNDLSFSVKKGEIFGLIGPNGAGKTTVFNCITQFYKPTSGSIYFKNKEDDITNLCKLNTHDMIGEGIARSFQNVELIWELTVLDNLLVAAHSLLLTDFVEHMLHTKKMKREEMVLRTKGYGILKDLGIDAYAFRSPYGLPYGILKKIELARTLMTDPSLIILDEPAAGLNDAETEELALIIKKINHDYGITIFLVEHDMGLVMSICDTVCVISFGKRIAIGKPIEVQNDPEVRKAYLGEDNDE